jgi:hypothetical protein
MITWTTGSSEIVHEASAFHLEFFHKDLVFIVVIKAMTHYRQSYQHVMLSIANQTSSHAFPFDNCNIICYHSFRDFLD